MSDTTPRMTAKEARQAALEDRKRHPPTEDQKQREKPAERQERSLFDTERRLEAKRPLKGRVKRQPVKTGTRLLARQKQRSALELRKSGATYQQIADALGYSSASGAYSAVRTAFSDVIHEPVKEVRTLQIERLNQMMLVLWPRVQQGDERAIAQVQSLMRDLNDLTGTRAPEQVDVNVTKTSGVLVIEGNEDEYIAAMKKMTGMIADDGTNKNRDELTELTQVPKEDDIIDAEVVDTTVDTTPDEPVYVVEEAKDDFAPRKKINLGVDPTV